MVQVAPNPRPAHPVEYLRQKVMLVTVVLVAATVVAPYIFLVVPDGTSRPSLGVTGVTPLICLGVTGFTSRVGGLGPAGAIMLRLRCCRGVGLAMLVGLVFYRSLA